MRRIHLGEKFEVRFSWEFFGAVRDEAFYYMELQGFAIDYGSKRTEIFTQVTSYVILKEREPSTEMAFKAKEHLEVLPSGNISTSGLEIATIRISSQFGLPDPHNPFGNKEEEVSCPVCRGAGDLPGFGVNSNQRHPCWKCKGKKKIKESEVADDE